MFPILAKLGLYAAVLSIVIVMPSTFFPFIGGKYYFFRVMVEGALVATLLWWAFEAREGELEERMQKLFDQPLFISVSLYVLFYLLASLFAYDPHAAFWSNYERGEGGFQMVHYYLFYALLGIFFTRKEDWMRLFKVSLGAAVIMLLYGVGAAMLSPNFVGPYQSLPDSAKLTVVERLFSHVRFQGSLGNPAYVAPYLLFSIFYALWLWWVGTRSRASTLLYWMLSLTFLVGFVLSQTRGGFLGLMAAVFVFLGYMIWQRPSARKGALVALGLIAAGGIILFQFRNEPWIEQVPGGRFLTINLEADSAQTRFWTWNSAWQGFKERPLLGWGPENFSPVFDKYFDTRHYRPGQNTETWFDRAHSVVFDNLVATGILGFLAYAGMFAVFYWRFFAGLRAGVGIETQLKTSSVLQGLLLVIPIAYLVQGVILFDVLPIYLNLFLVLAFAGYLLNPNYHSHHQS